MMNFYHWFRRKLTLYNKTFGWVYVFINNALYYKYIITA